MNILEKVQSVKLIRPEEGDMIVVLAKEINTLGHLEEIRDFFCDTINDLHPNKKIRLLVTNNIEDIKIIRKED